MGKSSKPTIGYKYYMTLQAGLCRGPVDAYLELRAGDRTAWSGVQSTSGTINVNAPNLFGGDKKEGGLSGTLKVYMGEDTQAADATLEALRGSPQPAYRGLLTLVYYGEVSALNPYIKTWKHKVRALVAGWRTAVWQSALCGIDLTECMAMNPAHILYRLWVEELGWDPSTKIDLTQHQAAAQTLYDEGMGLCFQWSRSEGINQVIGKICDHIGGVVVEDPTTGKNYLKLIRDDYVTATLPVLDKSNIIELMEYNQPSVVGTVNQVTGTFVYASNGKEGSVTAHNLANQQAQGAIVGKTIDYSMFPIYALAARAAQRDCNSLSSLLFTGKVRIKRPASPILRGDVYALTLALGKWTISGAPVRILEVDDGLSTDTSVVLKFAQDQFGVPATSYLATPTGGWTEPDLTPVAITAQLAMEASYRDLATRLSNANLAALDVDSGYLTTVGARPQSVAYNYTLMTELAGASAYAEVGAGDFAPSGTLHTAMAQEAGPTDIILDNATDLDQVEVGSEAMVDDGGGAFEICRVDAIDAAAGTATLARGCVDTPPLPHAAGAHVYFTDDYTASDLTEYVTGETVNAKLLTRTGLGELDISLATAINVTMAQRQARPYAPGGLLINGGPYPANVQEPLSLAWNHRDRLLQADQLIDTTHGNVGPESGTTYRVDVYLNGSLDSTNTGIASPSYSPTVSGYGNLEVRIYSVCGGLVSQNPLEAAFNYYSSLAISTSSPVNLNTTAGSSVTLQSSGGLGTKTWSVDALPSGLSLATDGTLSNDGTAAVGSTSALFTVTDGVGSTAQETITIDVNSIISARYWRINVTANNGGVYLAIAEMQFRNGVGIDQTSPASAAADASASTIANVANGANYAFDDDSSSKWSSQPYPTTEWLMWDFGAPVEIASVAVMGQYNGGDQANFAPKDFTIQYSADGSSWSTAVSVTGQTAWGAAEVRTFTW